MRTQSIAAAVGLLSAGSLCVAATSVTPVVMPGDTAPGTGGATFSGFSTPTLNNAGQVAFRATLELGGGVDFNNFQGVWTGGAGSLTLAARLGSTVPAQPELTITSISLPLINSAGHAAFEGFTSSGEAQFATGPGGVGIAARAGAQAPGLESGFNFGSFGGSAFPNNIRFNDLGQVAIIGSAINASNIGASGVWRGAPGALELLARSGDAAPGYGAGVAIRAFFYPQINGSGAVAFAALVEGPGVGFEDDDAIFVGTPGSLQLGVRSGNLVPGLPGVEFQGGWGSDQPAFNNAGHLAMGTGLRGAGVTTADDAALVAGAPGALNVVVRGGQQAPGLAAGVLFDDFSQVHLGPSGHLVFDGFLAGPGVTFDNEKAIYTAHESGGPIRLIARSGAQVPGAAAGTLFDFLDSTVINAQGQIAFSAILEGPAVTFENDLALFAADAAGNLITIARTGSPLDPGNGDVRIVDFLSFWGFSGNEDGLGSGLNDAGQIAFWASFTDGSEGVFLTTVPEPGAALLALLLPTVLLPRRRVRTAERV